MTESSHVDHGLQWKLALEKLTEHSEEEIKAAREHVITCDICRPQFDRLILLLDELFPNFRKRK